MADPDLTSKPDLDDAKRRLHNEIDQASQEADQILSAGAQALEDGTAALESSVDRIWEKAQEVYETVEAQTIEAAKAADQAIRKNPYPALGIAFGVGIVAGLLLRRK